MSKKRSSIRDNLLITMAMRAAYMDNRSDIYLPPGVIGEEVISDFIVKTVDKYIEDDLDINFDEYIEEALLKKFNSDAYLY